MKKITYVDFTRHVMGNGGEFFTIFVHRGKGYKNVRHYTCHRGDSMLNWMKKLHKLWIEATNEH